MKIKKIILYLLILLTLWLSLVITDTILPICFNHKPLFCYWKEKEKDGGSGLYQGLGYTIRIKGNFMPEQNNLVNYVQLKIFNISVLSKSK